MTASERTAAEAKADNIAVMGQSLGEQYSALWQELVWLYRVWGEYVELYGTKPSRVELLNRAAGSFFRVVQDGLWEQTLLHIARLTDPAMSAGKPNLSIRSLLSAIDDPTAKDAVSKRIDEALEASAFCRDWRNRRIAHRDLDLALERPSQPLAPASRVQVRSALDRIADVMNAVSQHYLDSETHFESTLHPGGGASLLYLLDSALELRAERDARLKRGDYRPEDFQRKEL
jgi:hypothetical protein